MALAAYRHVLRSARIAFHGDPRILSAARVEARSKFNSNRSLGPKSPEAGQKIMEAEETARILRQNVVQGEKVKASSNEEQRYYLRLHDEIERGNNESIKKGTSLAATGGSCCGGMA